MSHERTGSEASSFGSQSKHLAALAPRARGEGGGGARTHLTPDFPSQAGGRNGLPPAKGKMGVWMWAHCAANAGRSCLPVASMCPGVGVGRVLSLWSRQLPGRVAG